jgi:3-dehydroquinate synthase
MRPSSSFAAVPVALGKQGYDIMIGRDLLPETGARLKKLGLTRQAFVLTDETVAGYHLKALKLSLEQAEIAHHAIILPPGEQTKSFKTLEKVLGDMLAKKPERQTAVIALGGGVIGDLAGFAASVLLRGVPFVQIPTTLLSMVDSSVGGKTGINAPEGKNLIGSFYQPRLVLADISLLDTLPHREFLAGYAEVVKYGLIGDAKFFDWLTTKEQDIKTSRIVVPEAEADLTRMIRTSCEAKAAVVAEDEKEAGKRALLNLGHTFGHALELEMGYSSDLLHGEAVAIGMVLAFKLSVRLGLCKKDDAEKLERHLAALGMRTSISQLGKAMDAKRLMQHMAGDKKVKQGKIVFILAKAIGQAFIADDVDPKDAQAVLEADMKAMRHAS